MHAILHTPLETFKANNGNSRRQLGMQAGSDDRVSMHIMQLQIKGCIYQLPDIFPFQKHLHSFSCYSSDVNSPLCFVHLALLVSPIHPHIPALSTLLHAPYSECSHCRQAGLGEFLRGAPPKRCLEASATAGVHRPIQSTSRCRLCQPWALQTWRRKGFL